MRIVHVMLTATLMRSVAGLNSDQHRVISSNISPLVEAIMDPQGSRSQHPLKPPQTDTAVSITHSETREDVLPPALTSVRNSLCSKPITAGQIAAVSFAVQGTMAKLDMAITQIEPIGGKVTLNCAECNTPVTMHFQQDLRSPGLVEILEPDGQAVTVTDALSGSLSADGMVPRAVQSPRTTVKIMDKWPGHTTLDPPKLSNSSVETVSITLRPINSQNATLIPTTDANGRSILRTMFAQEETLTVNVSLHGSRTPSIWSIAHGNGTETASTTISHSTSSEQSDAFPSAVNVSALTVTIFRSTTITRTVSQTPSPRCPQSPVAVFTTTEIVASVNDTSYPIDAPTKLLRNKTLMVLAPTARASLYPLDRNVVKLLQIAQHLDSNFFMGIAISHLQGLYYGIDDQEDWPTNPSAASPPIVGRSLDDHQLAAKNALRILQQYFENTTTSRSPSFSVHAGATLTLAKLGNSFYTLTGPTTIYRNNTPWEFDPAFHLPTTTSMSAVVDLGSTTATITLPTQTLPDGQVIAVFRGVASPSPKPKFLITERPRCRDYNDTHKCALERCMWDYMKPIRITTVFPAIMADPLHTSRLNFNWFTQTTLVNDRPHWGTTDPGLVYYPLYTKSRLAENGEIQTKIARESPLAVPWSKRVAAAPACWDEASCATNCDIKVAHSWSSKTDMMAFFVGGALVGLVLVALITYLFYLCLRRCCQRAGAESAGSISPMYQNSPSASDAFDPGSQSVGAIVERNQALPTVAERSQESSTSEEQSHATAFSTGQAAGSDANDGRGTLSRRAEEGRSHIRTPAASVHRGDSDTITTERTGGPAVNTIEEEIKTLPLHQTDGTGSLLTGSEPVYMGSIRGRKLSQKGA